MFELAFRPAPFSIGRTSSSTCSCDACNGNAQELDDEDFEEDFDEHEVCPECGEVHELEGDVQLRDIVLDPVKPGVFGKPSSEAAKARTTTKRCKTEHACPIIKTLRSVDEIDGVPFEYVGGGKKSGIYWDKTTRRWQVVERLRIKRRPALILPETAQSIANFIANMRAAGLPLEAILTMGSLNCRCMTGTDSLSNHSYGDAYDFAGLRLADGREFLVANTQCDADTLAVMHRANACLRLSFPHVMDYYNVKKWPYSCQEADKLRSISHWNHIHCDHYKSWKPSQPWYMSKKGADWRYVRVALGLPVTGGLDDACKQALKAFAGSDALDSAAKRGAALSKLYMREAQRT